ncbi:unnamed protein product, partial [Ectocarpus sp. 12 AP-2014]
VPIRLALFVCGCSLVVVFFPQPSIPAATPALTLGTTNSTHPLSSSDAIDFTRPRASPLLLAVGNNQSGPRHGTGALTTFWTFSQQQQAGGYYTPPEGYTPTLPRPA